MDALWQGSVHQKLFWPGEVSTYELELLELLAPVNSKNGLTRSRTEVKGVRVPCDNHLHYKTKVASHRFDRWTSWCFEEALLMSQALSP